MADIDAGGREPRATVPEQRSEDRRDDASRIGAILILLPLMLAVTGVGK